MIAQEDLYNYFDREYELARESHLQLMKLPLRERVRKRKAVDNLIIDFSTEPWRDGSDLFFIVLAPKNIADFKEGDILRLHTEDNSEGVECTLTDFEGDAGMVLSISSFNNQQLVYQWRNRRLVLDKTLVDLRKNVYCKFLQAVPSDREWWAGLLVNSRRKPSFLRCRECEETLSETERELGVTLNPRQREAVLRCMETDDYYLVQGPPGTGKSFILGLIVLEELIHFRRRIAVIGPNHLAINNVLEQMLKTVPQYSGRLYKIGQFYNAPRRRVVYDGEEREVRNVARMSHMGSDALRQSYVVGMTPHALFTSRAKDLVFDTLVIDEAGQMSVPLALMGMVKARKIILAGDHKQLPPIINAERIRPELKKSVFQLLADRDNCTMLNQTFRMNEGICAFVSELFYGGEVVSCAGIRRYKALAVREPLGLDYPVVMLDVRDEGEQTSEKEAEAIASVVGEYIGEGVGPEEIGVLTPFRAQATVIRKALRKTIPHTMKESPVVVETIDKMQGQEKEIIILSFVAGELKYMEEMGEFLYNPQKMNVAFSRAKSKLVLVGNVSALERLSPEEFPAVSQILSSPHLRFFEAYPTKIGNEG